MTHKKQSRATKALNEFDIVHLGPKGDGIARGHKGPVYIERALPHERVLARTWRADQGVMRGELKQVLEPSPDRVKPACPHYDECGGCTLQHADDGFYQGWKQALVHDALSKLKLRPRKWEAPVFIAAHTRRRATFAAFKNGERVTMGYFKRRSDRVTDIKTCLIAAPEILDMRDKLKPLLSPILKPGRKVDIFIQYMDGAYDVLITGPIGGQGKPDLAVREAMADMAQKAGIGRLSWRARVRDGIEVMVQRAAPIASFGPLRVTLPPAAFLQPTAPGQAALVDGVMRHLPSQGKFADLFSGCGTFSGPMLANGSVDAYESVDEAVRVLSKAAGGHNLKAFKRDLFRNPLRREEANRYDAIVFDPPRAGAKEQVSNLASSKVGKLIAVSCNPATFARDARILCDGAYRLDTVGLVDQFTYSHHVEIVASFSHK